MKKFVLVFMIIFGVSLNSSFHNYLNATQLKTSISQSNESYILQTNYQDEGIYLENPKETESDSVLSSIFGIIVGIIVLILPLFWGPSRKGIGLLNIILGIIFCFSGVGIVIGIPMILFGAIIFYI